MLDGHCPHIGDLTHHSESSQSLLLWFLSAEARLVPMARKLTIDNLVAGRICKYSLSVNARFVSKGAEASLKSRLNILDFFRRALTFNLLI